MGTIKQLLSRMKPFLEVDEAGGSMAPGGYAVFEGMYDGWKQFLRVVAVLDNGKSSNNSSGSRSKSKYAQHEAGTEAVVAALSGLMERQVDLVVARSRKLEVLYICYTKWYTNVVVNTPIIERNE